MKRLLIVVLVMVCINPVSAFPVFTQEKENEVYLLKSAQGIVILYNKGNLHLTIEFKGELQGVLDQQMSMMIDNKFVQVQIADNSEFLQTTDKTSLKDEDILKKHQVWEQDYLQGVMNAKLKPELKSVTTKRKRTALFWYFPMPEGLNSKVSHQVFLTTVIGDHVLVLDSALEKNMSLSNLEEYLITSLDLLEVSDKQIKLKTAQDQGYSVLPCT